MNTPQPRPPVVDVHAHVDVPQLDALVRGQPGYEAELVELRATFGARSAAINAGLGRTRYRAAFDDPRERVAWMDRAAVDLQVVSVVPTQYHYWAEPGLRARLRRSRGSGVNIRLDRDRCESHGMCAATAPNLIALDADATSGAPG